MKKLITVCFILLGPFCYSQAPFGNVLELPLEQSFAANTPNHITAGATPMGSLNTSTTPITIEFFFRPCNNSLTPSTYYGLFNNGQMFNPNAFLNSLGGIYDSNPSDLFDMYFRLKSNGSYDNSGISNFVFGNNQWHHIVLELNYDIGFGHYRIAMGIDGEVATYYTFSGTTFNVWYNQYFTVGIDSTLNGDPIMIFGTSSLPGSYDEFRISRTLNYNLWNNGSTPGWTYPIPATEFIPNANTYALWHFNDAPGDTVLNDASGNNYHLKPVNGANTTNPITSGNLYPLSNISVCTGQTISLSGAFSYHWSPSVGISNPDLANPVATENDTTITYIITGFELATCNLIYDTLTVVFQNGPSLLGPDFAACPYPDFILDAGAGYTSYLWSTGETTQTISTSLPGTYYVTANGGVCNGTDTINVTSIFTDFPDLGPDIQMCAGDTYSISPGGIGWVSYLWQDSSTGFAFTQLTGNDTAWVQTTNLQGCVAFDTIYSTLIPNLLTGTILDHLGSPLANSNVYAVYYDTTNAQLIVVDTTTTNAAGYYQLAVFNSPIGILALPDSATYPLDAPTYHFGDFIFNIDSAASLACIDSTINFQTITNAGILGPINIPGVFVIGGRELGDSIPDVTLVLVDTTGVPVRFQRTNADGLFDFSGLIAGKYEFWADLPFINNQIAPFIIVEDIDSTRLLNVRLGLFPDHLEILEINYNTMSLPDPLSELYGISFYPNPADDFIHISNPQAYNYRVRIYNALGQIFYDNQNVSDVTVDCSTWPASIYIIEFIDDNKTSIKDRIIIR